MNDIIQMMNKMNPHKKIAAMTLPTENATLDKSEVVDSFINTSISYDLNFKKNKLVPKTSIEVEDDLNFNPQKDIKSPKEICLVRRSQASPKIFSEKISLNQKRYDYKMAKNNSVDNMGWLSENYESKDNSRIKETGPGALNSLSIADHLSVNSERPKVSVDIFIL